MRSLSSSLAIDVHDACRCRAIPSRRWPADKSSRNRKRFFARITADDFTQRTEQTLLAMFGLHQYADYHTATKPCWESSSIGISLFNN